ncbi:hypothetical protein CC2G_003527 [Coprinopsis cinerea AmutBmut pab1-1]|uniref:CCL1 lectin n=1 Tax=Coprinopsis cinerea TaxID=5346 RepID=E3VW05_COPCI|nr:CCL1 lectin [Coprinopsis cinerea]KAG2005028.1 hypothetical protein CC2G_003527 [Coprinopsis cinerea AmutBmut pab1-1]
MDTQAKPPAGRYVIYNRVLSPNGEKLALTYPGYQREALTLTPLHHSANQIWILNNWDATTSSLTPETARNTQVGWGSGNVPIVLPPGNYVWTLASSAGGYIIQDGGKTVYWNAGEAVANTKVSIGGDNGLQARWIFERV